MKVLLPKSPATHQCYSGHLLPGTSHTTADPNMSTLVLEGEEVDSVRVVLCGTVVVDRGEREEEDAVVECTDGRRFPVVKETLSACSGFFR